MCTQPRELHRLARDEKPGNRCYNNIGVDVDYPNSINMCTTESGGVGAIPKRRGRSVGTMDEFFPIPVLNEFFKECCAVKLEEGEDST